MAKQTTRSDIKDATQALKMVMKENLSAISEAMIEQVLKNWRNSTESQRFNAIKDVSPTGVQYYKEALLNAYAVIAAESIKKARREVPKKRNVRLAEIDEDALQLGEFDSLPIDIQKRLKSMLDLLVGTQISDLEKQVFFQYTSSVDTTETESVLAKDLNEAAGEFIDGASVNAASGANASQIVNEARLAFFADDDVSEEIEAYEFVNGDPVSLICQDLAGTVFAKDDPNLNRYWPPLHFNCKSYIVPILKGNLGSKEVTSLEPSKASLNKYVQLSENFEEGLRLLSEDMSLGGPGSGRRPEDGSKKEESDNEPLNTTDLKSIASTHDTDEIVYHGSLNNDLKGFDNADAEESSGNVGQRKGVGVSFSPNKSYAESYASKDRLGTKTGSLYRAAFEKDSIVDVHKNPDAVKNAAKKLGVEENLNKMWAGQPNIQLEKAIAKKYPNDSKEQIYSRMSKAGIKGFSVEGDYGKEFLVHDASAIALFGPNGKLISKGKTSKLSEIGAQFRGVI